VLEAPAAPALTTRIGPRGESLTVVTEQIAEFGGVERIAEAVLMGYPAATLLAGRFDPAPGFPHGEFEARLAARRLEADLLGPARVQLLGAGGSRRHFLTPLYARRLAAERLAPAAAVLSIGGMAWTLATRIPEGARHVGYVGVPRSYYGYRRDYLSEYSRPARVALNVALPALRRHHRRLLRRPDRLVTNSRHSASLLRPLAGRELDVLYPPVRTDFFTPAPERRRHFLAVSRLRAHKRLDPVVEAFRRLGQPLVIAGEGPVRERERLNAPANVKFAGHVGDAELRELYRTSHAVVSASVEEFGIGLAEAQSTGTPAIAPRAGGSGEIVRHGESGLLLDSVDPDSIVAAVRSLDRIEIDPGACRRSAERFSEARFIAELEQLLES
jgi:glycosyltransferase involved in cell wall biosynthesis